MWLTPSLLPALPCPPPPFPQVDFDTNWGPNWHVVIGRNFGSFVTHETKNFVFFYLGDKAIMLFKAG